MLSEKVAKMAEYAYQQVCCLLQSDFPGFDCGGLKEIETPDGVRQAYFSGINVWETVMSATVMYWCFQKASTS